ncbi:hypothetical protein RRG08_013606 [Elysia crispata]|uniref:Uncharacterized protein n=1 Tax=Elysia crispata TaxID=231223 RepID=A0AAE1AN77_9GAST|nr:hypothetical protein RRG08_013606 [Elysia crispata]
MAYENLINYALPQQTRAQNNELYFPGPARLSSVERLARGGCHRNLWDTVAMRNRMRNTYSTVKASFVSF